MSRSWQYMGFTPAAQAILDEQIKIGMKVVVELDLAGHPTHTYTQDLFKPAYTKEKYRQYEPWYDEGMPLHILTFRDGRKIEEYVQEEPWDSGPMTFMALRDHVTKEPLSETLWTMQQIFPPGW